MEEYKQITEFIKTTRTSEIYVSNFGNIKRKLTNGDEKITTGSNVKGYRVIRINGKMKRIHRLVGEYFIENPNPEYTMIDHSDRSKVNNHFTNLRWCCYFINNSNKSNYKKMGHIRKIKEGAYRFQYVINKQQKSKTFKTEIDAITEQLVYQVLIEYLEEDI